MTKANWPFPRLTRSLFLAFGLVLLTICLYPFWGTIAVAAVFAFGFKQPLLRLRTRFGFNRKLSIALAVCLLVISLLLPISVVSLRLYQIAAGNKEKGASGAFSAQTLEQVSGAYGRLESTVAEFANRFNVYENTAEARAAIQENLGTVAKRAFAIISATLLEIPDLVVSLIVFALFFYLFLSQGKAIGGGLVKLGAISEHDAENLSSILQKSCYSAIVTNLVLGTVQASIVAVGARICGYKEMAVIFTVVFFLSFIPIIGAAPTAFLLSLISFLSGNVGAGIGMAVIGLVSGSIDNVLRPYLISGGDNEGHPILSFAAIIGAITVLGLKGLFLGPVILTATFALLHSHKEAA